MRESVIYQEILQRGEAVGEAKGKAIGKAESLRELVLSMIAEEFAIETIARLTQLTPEEIHQIQGN